jgi:membrane protein DedA with SNARE-associated domain
MTEKILAFLVQFVTGVIDSGGYAGIVALMGIESACIPLPSEIIMPFAGYLVYKGSFNLLWVATAGAVGCNLGSVVAYWIGAKGGRPLVERYGRWVLMSHHDLDRMEQYFARYGSITVLVGRLLPVVRTFIAFPAGIARMPQLRFHIYTFVGSWPWCFALAYAGLKLARAGTIPTRPFIHCSIVSIPSSWDSCWLELPCLSRRICGAAIRVLPPRAQKAARRTLSRLE